MLSLNTYYNKAYFFSELHPRSSKEYSDRGSAHILPKSGWNSLAREEVFKRMLSKELGDDEASEGEETYV